MKSQIASRVNLTRDNPTLEFVYLSFCRPENVQEGPLALRTGRQDYRFYNTINLHTDLEQVKGSISQCEHYVIPINHFVIFLRGNLCTSSNIRVESMNCKALCLYIDLSRAMFQYINDHQIPLFRPLLESQWQFYFIDSNSVVSSAPHSTHIAAYVWHYHSTLLNN